MDINITHLMNRREDMRHYSASRAELGDDAGQVTWQNSLDMFDDDNLDQIPDLVTGEDDLSELRDYFAEFGAWDEEEIAAWTPQECNALLLQMIAGDMRERQHYEDADNLERYEENYGGRIIQCGDVWLYYIGL